MNKVKVVLSAVSVSLAMAFTLGCSSDDGDEGSGGGKAVYGSPVEYNGETYKTVVIGTQTWMAKNLNYKVEGSKCYNDSIGNCEEYGRLYDWATAMALPSECNTSKCEDQINEPHQGICPAGWHLPSYDEWLALEKYIEDIHGHSTAGKHLRTKSGWTGKSIGGKSEGGENTYGFAALPGGYGYTDSWVEIGYSFNGTTEYGDWWSSTEYSGSKAYGYAMYTGNDVSSIVWDDKAKYFYSVRCVKD